MHQSRSQEVPGEFFAIYSSPCKPLLATLSTLYKLGKPQFFTLTLGNLHNALTTLVMFAEEIYNIFLRLSC